MFALGFFDRIFFGVFGEFDIDGLGKINTEDIRQFEKVHRHIGELVRDLVLASLPVGLDFPGLLPLEMFENFRGFQNQGQSHVLVIVELHPVPLIPEFLNFFRYFFYLTHKQFAFVELTFPASTAIRFHLIRASKSLAIPFVISHQSAASLDSSLIP